MGKRVETVMFDYKKENRGVREFFPFHDYDNVLNVDKIKCICPEETDPAGQAGRGPEGRADAGDRGGSDTG